MILYLILLVIVVSMIEEYTLRHALDNVTYDTYPSKTSTQPDEVFEIITVIENKKRLPVSFLKIQESLPYDLEAKNGVVLRRDTELSRLTTSTFLKPKQRLERRFEASLPRRGRYFLHGATLYGGDFLGLKHMHDYYPVLREIVVIPRELEGVKIGKTLGDFLGDMSVNRFIMEDPVLTLGFREYTGREPQRAISWTQSARMGQTMVKNYDHTLDLSVTVLLNVAHGDIENAHEKIEACFSAAHSVCKALEEQRIKYGLITNATAAGAIGLWSQVGDGLGDVHLSTILEGLGRATYLSTDTFEAIAGRALRRDEAGRSYIVITPELNEHDAATISRLESLKGGRVLTIEAGKLGEAE